MATVYLAHDVKHDRKVALKVLRPELAAVIGAERFLAEIKTTANLQHPNILPLYDSGEADSFLYYVMPFIAGETLRDRLQRDKQLSIEDAVELATEIGSALDYAHRQDVIHRDIKPENVLLHDGRAMVADFGIALAVSSAGGGTRMTETGMSLGTPHYMSPEQAMGERELTARTDVYALGAVMYEMLAGEPPFSGPTAQAIVARVVTEAPRPLKPMRHTIPIHVEAATLKALEKLPADRFATAAEFGAALKNPALTAAFASQAIGAASPAAAPRWAMAGWGVAAVFAAATVWLAVRSTDLPTPSVTRFIVGLPEARPVSSDYWGNTLAISPDGSKVAYVGRAAGGRSQLWLREESALGPVPLSGTEGADGPFFSPDGEWVGYSSNGQLFKVSTTSGSPVLLADQATRVLTSGAWLKDGSIVFTDRILSLMRVSENGGDVETIAPQAIEGGWAFPTPLPRTDKVLVSLCTANCAQMSIVVVDLDTGERKVVAEDGNRGWYLPTGHLVYVQSDGVVLARPFDLDRAEPTGPAVQVLNQVQVQIGIMPEFAVSETGTLMYLRNDATQGVVPVRVDRDGLAVPLDSTWTSNVNSLALSPDGRRLAVSVGDGRRVDLWVKELEDGPLSRLTFEGSLNYRPSWTPDGRALSFTSDRAGGRSYLYSTRADGSGVPERISPADTNQVDEALWTPDGQYLIYRTGVGDGSRNIHLRRLSDSSYSPLVVGRFDAYSPALSPDGRWLAYVSSESGREEVYVRPFPDTDRARWLVSSAGGAQPLWAHSGRELYYINADGTLTAVEVDLSGEFSSGRERGLFSTGSYSIAPFHQSYAVTHDDRHFVMLNQSQAGQAPDLVVVLNWFTEVEELMGSE